MYKVWNVLITCTSRAIYLDITSSLHGLACIKVLQRFSSHYGQPKLIISDNGSNFTSREVQNYANVKGIKWNYNLRKTPWAGGFFERLIRSVKRCLRKLLNVLKVNYEDLLTILIEIQRVINKRPLTYNYNDVNSEPLTPNHLIIGRRLHINYFNENSTLVGTNQFLEKSIERFWKLWSKEYLGSLREQHSYVKNKNHQEKDTTCVGDIVLVSENTPRTK